MTKGIYLAIIFTYLALPVCGQVTVSLTADGAVTASWRGRLVVLPSQPALRRLGGASRFRFDPVSRQARTVALPAAQDVYLNVYNSRNEQVYLGEPHLKVEKRGGGVMYREDYPTAGTSWEVALLPVEDNGLDLFVRVETDPEFRLGAFDLNLLDLNFARAALDCGAISSWARAKRVWDDPGPYTREDLSISYPDGSGCYVPVAAMQDANLALGVSLLGAHRSLLPQYGCSLQISPVGEKKCYHVNLRSVDNPFFGNVYHQRIAKQYRFRLSPPVPPGPRGYFGLLDAKHLWHDYVAELDRYVPRQLPPAYDKTKNNLILMNFFMSEGWLVSPTNPQGYLMADPRWKSNPWEWREKITPEMSADEVKRITGFSDENMGSPVRWIQAFALKNVREMEEANAQALITWTSAQTADMYPPESHLFPPELEELMPVAGSVRNWDWVQGDLTVANQNDEQIIAKRNVLIRAFDPEDLIHMEQTARTLGARQRLKFAEADLTAEGKRYAATAAQLTPRDRLTDHVALILELNRPRHALLGRRPGEQCELEAVALSNDTSLAAERLRVIVKVTGVHRAAIDEWARILADAGVEFGFLVREDFTVGLPWHQWCQRFDWTADWQYKMVKQRLQWHRERFGERCRWFYLDVFGNYTPPFVFETLRADFPDCFFFAEHPYDAVQRTVQGWNWFGPMSDLERYIAPDTMVAVLPERILTGDSRRDREIMRKLWRDPHCWLVTHRGAPMLLRLAQEAGLPVAPTSQPPG